MSQGKDEPDDALYYKMNQRKYKPDEPMYSWNEFEERNRKSNEEKLAKGVKLKNIEIEWLDEEEKPVSTEPIMSTLFGANDESVEKQNLQQRSPKKIYTSSLYDKLETPLMLFLLFVGYICAYVVFAKFLSLKDVHYKQYTSIGFLSFYGLIFLYASWRQYNEQRSDGLNVITMVVAGLFSVAITVELIGGQKDYFYLRLFGIKFT